MRIISSVAEKLLASQAGFGYMELFMNSDSPDSSSVFTILMNKVLCGVAKSNENIRFYYLRGLYR